MQTLFAYYLISVSSKQYHILDAINLFMTSNYLKIAMNSGYPMESSYSLFSKIHADIQSITIHVLKHNLNLDLDSLNRLIMEIDTLKKTISCSDNTNAIIVYNYLQSCFVKLENFKELIIV